MPKNKKLWRQLFKMGAIHKVEVVSKSGKCRLWLYPFVSLGQEDIEVCRHFLEKRFPGFEFAIKLQKLPAATDLTSFCQQNKTAILEEAANCLGSGSSVWLAGARLESKEKILQLVLPATLAAESLKASCGDEVLKNILQRYGYQVDVEIVTDASYREKLLQDSQQRQIKKIEQVQNQIMTGKNNNLNERVKPDWLLGRKITLEPCPLKEIVEEEKQVCVCGEVDNFVAKELKSGRWLVSYDLTDYTDSITVKTFTKQGPLTEPGLCSGEWVRAQGTVQHDSYSGELILIPKAMVKETPPQRRDNAPQKRIELHLHTKMSALDAVTDVEAVIRQVAEWGHKAVAITDHGVLQAFPDAAAAGRKYGVKIIYGLEGYLFDQDNQPPDRQRTYHIVLLAKNKQGMENLYRLVSRSHLDFFYRKPRLPRHLLQQYRQGLLLGTACEAGELISSYLEGSDMDRLQEIASFYDYLEIQPLGNNDFLVRQGRVPNQQALIDMNKKIIALGNKLEKPVIAAGDVHFLNPEDAVYRRILLAGQGYTDEIQAPLYLRSTEEMLAEFNYLDPETASQVVITNPGAIAEQIEELKPIPDKFHPPEIPGAETELTQIVTIEAHKRYGKPLPQMVKDRLDKEMQAIMDNGFAVLYLVAHKLTQKSNEEGYLVGSRGSVGSSLVATMAGITEVNPLPPHYCCLSCQFSQFVIDGSVSCGVDLPEKKCPRCGEILYKDGHNIPFEVFLGYKGDKIPDIDLNFSGEYQPRAHQYAEEIFGKDYVFRAGTIATLAERTSFGFVRKYQEKQEEYPVRQAEINRLVKGISGVKRTTGQHPGGLMVIPQGADIHLFTPLQHPADDTDSNTVTTHFDYRAISRCLVKLDLLGHDDPTIIKMLEDHTGVDAREIPLDEPQTMSLFSCVEALGVQPEDIGSQVGTLGIPEFGTRFVRQMLEEIKPKTFADLVRISGFSHGTDVWLNNARELIKNGTAALREAISTRDDIMNYLIDYGMPANIAFEIMEDVRKGRGIKKDFEMAIRTAAIPQWFIESCRKIKYLFPKAHAVAYVTMAFRIAYFKVYYPEAFYASFLTMRANEFDVDMMSNGLSRVHEELEALERKGNKITAREKNVLTILEVVREMYHRGITINCIDLQKADASCFQVDGKILLPPLVSLASIGQTAAEAIVKARKVRPFSSVEDLQQRTRVSKTVIEALEKHGSLSGMPVSDQLTFF